MSAQACRPLTAEGAAAMTPGSEITTMIAEKTLEKEREEAREIRRDYWIRKAEMEAEWDQTNWEHYRKQ